MPSKILSQITGVDYTPPISYPSDRFRVVNNRPREIVRSIATSACEALRDTGIAVLADCPGGFKSFTLGMRDSSRILVTYYPQAWEGKQKIRELEMACEIAYLPNAKPKVHLGAWNRLEQEFVKTLRE